MSNETYQFAVDEKNEGLRLDKFLAEQLPNLSRNRIQNLISQGQVNSSEGPLTDRNYRVKKDQVIGLVVPEPENTSMKPANIPLTIVFEDEHLLVIDKPAGLTVHPGAGNHDDTLANALIAHCGDSLSGIGGEKRPGIVHRLDKDTSGLLLVAKHDKAHTHLAAQLEARTIKRIYLAIVWGTLTPSAGKISANIGRSSRDRTKMTVLKNAGKPALTHYKTIETFGNIASLLECRLETGRTHQIRVHLTHKGHPLIGDQTYGKGRAQPSVDMPDIRRQALHATEITFIHPNTEAEMHFTSPLGNPTSEDIQNLLNCLRSYNQTSH